MSKSEIIQFRFPTVRQKLQNLFPFDPKYDIQIQFKKNKYQLQLAYLRIQSGYFKNYGSNISRIVKIQEDFNEDYFEQIMKCFYGGTFNCPFSSVIEVWKIFDFLKIQNFKREMIKAIKQNFTKFNFFKLFAFVYQNNIQQLFNHSLLVLDKQNYGIINKQKNQMLKCPLQVLKFLLNTHNRRKQDERSLTYIEINEILKDYCQINHYSEEYLKQLKFQLIEKTQLTSEQYKTIFIQCSKAKSTKQIQLKKQQPIDSQKVQKISESAHFQSYDKLKRDKSQNQNWTSKLICLKKQFEKNHKQYKNLEISVSNLSKILKLKSNQFKINEKNLSQMELSIREIEKQIHLKGEALTKITDRVHKLEKGSAKNKMNQKLIELEKQEDDVFVESHIIPGFVIGDMMTQHQRNQPQTNQKVVQSNNAYNVGKHKNSGHQEIRQRQNSIDTSYRNSLSFDRQPTCIPKRYFPSLARLLETDQFVKKKMLNLVFKRSKTETIGNAQSIKNKSGLLVLFQTNFKKFAGGFISVEIPLSFRLENICDYQSFLFSLTYNAKFPIKKGEQKLAISLSKHYLISFGNDLMLSDDCLNEDSYCQWPSLYDTVEFSKCKTAKQLVGGSEFRIEEIQIYEVKSEQIQMIL